MRTISSIPARHRGHEMLDCVLNSAIPPRWLKWETRHNDNGGKRVKFEQAVAIFLPVFPLRQYRSSLSGTELKASR